MLLPLCWMLMLCGSTHVGYVTLLPLCCVGLARTINMRCIYGVLGREITKYTVIYGAYTQFWPSLTMWDADYLKKVISPRPTCAMCTVRCCDASSIKWDAQSSNNSYRSHHFSSYV
jgi:hypothetical protein